ncbi:unnamed protein product, partial [Rotaria magnacalcarata]
MDASTTTTTMAAAPTTGRERTGASIN